MTMRFIGSSFFDHLGTKWAKARNKTNVFVELPQIFLAKGADLRYMEFYQDYSGQIWVKRPAGKQTLLPRPYKILNRFNGEFSYQEFQ